MRPYDGDRLENILNIASHYAAAVDLICDSAEIRSALEVLLRAIDIAIEKTTYDVAHEWANVSLRLASRGLGEVGWLTHHSLFVEIHLKVAHSAWLSQRYLNAIEVIQGVLLPREDLSIEARVTALEWKSIVECKLGQMESALCAGIDALRLLGVPLQLDYAMDFVKGEMEKTYGEIEEWGGLERLLEEEFTLSMTWTAQKSVAILNNVIPIVYLLQKMSLMCMLSISSVRHTLQYGLCYFSPNGIATFGLSAIFFFHWYLKGSRMCQFAEKLSRRLPASFQSTTLYYSAFGIQWTTTAMTSANLFKESIALNAGSNRDNYYSYSCSQYVDASVCAGCEVRLMSNFLEESQPSIERSGQRDMAMEMEKKWGWLKWIAGESAGTPSEPPDMGTLPFNFSSYYFYGCLSAFCADEIKEAYAYLTKLNSYFASSRGLPHFYEFHFLRVIITCAAVRVGCTSLQSVAEGVEESIVLLKEWAEIAPQNWQARAAIAEADWEIARAYESDVTPQTAGLPKRTSKSLKRLLMKVEEAVEEAEEMDQLHIAAFGLRVAAAIASKMGLKRAKALYLTNAHDLLLMWGCRRSPRPSLQAVPTSASALPSEFDDGLSHCSLDSVAVVSAAQLLSTFQTRESLYAAFFRVLMSSAGATQIVLALTAHCTHPNATSAGGGRDSGDVAKTELGVGGRGEKGEKCEKGGGRRRGGNTAGQSEGEPTVVASQTSGASVDYSMRVIGECMPISIANVVTGSGKAVCVKNMMESRFISDPFVKSHPTKSAMCFPILHKGEPRGFVYLTNDAIAGVFEESRCALVKVLATQLILSLDNNEAFEMLQRTNLDLQSLDKMKDDFLARVSHELRTPLNGIIGIASDGRMDRNRSKAEMEEDFVTIEKCGNHLLSIINDVLDFSKLKHNQMELQFEA